MAMTGPSGCRIYELDVPLLEKLQKIPELGDYNHNEEPGELSCRRTIHLAEVGRYDRLAIQAHRADGIGLHLAVGAYQWLLILVC
jgi:hypothetical protein